MERHKELLHVSTHSRPKAAGCDRGAGSFIVKVSTHSRPKAAGYIFFFKY